MASNSLPDHPVQCRHLRVEEILLVLFLLSKHPRGAELIVGLQNARVADMADGGMGSVTFDPDHVRKFGRVLLEASCVDLDEVVLSIALNVDERGELFELDIWKVDFSTLCAIPSPDVVWEVTLRG